MFDNYIRAFFKRHGILHPDELLIGTFLELMLEELKIAEWIGRQKQDFLVRILTKAAEKTATKETKQPKTKTDKALVIGQPQLGLPTKPEGN